MRFKIVCLIGAGILALSNAALAQDATRNLNRGFPFVVGDGSPGSLDVYKGKTRQTVIVCNDGQGNLLLRNPENDSETRLDVVGGTCAAINGLYIRIQISGGTDDVAGRFWFVD